MANDCNEIMCDLGLNSKEDAKKWLLQNHPDKGGKVDLGVFSRATECYKAREFCEAEESSMRASATASASASAKASSGKALDKSALNKRAKIFSCMRQTENWSKMMPQHKLDNKKFDPNEVEAAIHDASPKLEQLFRIIEQVDKNDMATHGKYFKHFIFSDVKEQGYGAKIIASAFIADGYYNLLEAKKIPNQKALRLSLNETKADEKDFAFGMLSSTALFKADFNQKFKKQVLTTYNKRPDNIHGENMRFIILDSGFKEGIDLFDVKYVHIFEPSMTIADLKQTIGRATRTCGQKGLNFEPNVGWPLYVYNYYIAIPDEIKEEFKASNIAALGIAPEDEMLFRNTKLKDAAMLYSQFDKTLTSLAEQLYKLAPVFSVDFALTKNIHRIHDATYLYDVTEQGQGQGQSALSSSSGGANSNLKNLDKIKCQGKCGLRSTKDIPATVPFLHKVYLKYKHDRKLLPKKGANDKKYFNLDKRMRAFFCAYMKQHPLYCQQVNVEWANRAAMVPSLVHARQSSSSKKANSGSYLDVQPATEIDLENDIDETEYLEILPASANKTRKTSSSSRKSSSSSKTKTTKLNKKLRLRRKSQSEPKSASSLKIANDVMQELQLVPYVAPVDNKEYAIEEYTGTKDLALRQKEPGPPSKRLNFAKMRDFIKTNFSQSNFIWDKIEVVNKCVDKPVADVKIGGASRIMTLNPTQDFVRTYFTPESPYKGLLLFHSVGTGKTCSAIATATSTYEREGYTILWVTRNTLKSDVYKNMFDDVCHIILAERMQRDGLKIPDDPSQRKRLLSKNWIEPISYKTFSNLLTPGGHNVYLDKLIAKNGQADVLRKTLIIIDEAHKLYGGDLKAAERPDMAVMERLLQNSYDKSGKDSARLLIMTATPFTNSPMELFKLINLCKEVKAEHITTDIKEFKASYMGADNMLSEAGSKKLADKLSGYISYLNREQDPTQFAQPVMIEVPAIMSHLTDNELRQAIFNENDKSKWEAEEQKTNLKRDLEYIKELKQRLKETQKNGKDKLRQRKDKCKTIKNREEKAKCNKEAEEENEREVAAVINEIREEIEELKNDAIKGKETIRGNKNKVRDMKDKIRNLKDSLLQEIALVKRCKNVELTKAAE
jgi:hypothetical protein